MKDEPAEIQRNQSCEITVNPKTKIKVEGIRQKGALSKLFFDKWGEEFKSEENESSTVFHFAIYGPPSKQQKIEDLWELKLSFLDENSNLSLFFKSLADTRFGSALKKRNKNQN
jgi:hypothetical protein